TPPPCPPSPPLTPPPPRPPLFPYTTLFRSAAPLYAVAHLHAHHRRPHLLGHGRDDARVRVQQLPVRRRGGPCRGVRRASPSLRRSEEHTSELQSRFDLVCRLLLEKKKSNLT